MDRVLKFVAAVGFGFALVSLDGCQEAKDKTRSTMSFVKGDADAVVERTPEQVMEAARAVAGEMHLIVISAATTQTSEGKDVRVLTARSAEDKKVTVRVSAETETATRLSVNTGLFGDSALRQQVIDNIKTRLGVATTRPTTQGVK